MKIFIAGAAGAIGQSLTPQLIRNGHTVVGTTRGAANRSKIEAMGAEALIMDGLDPEGVRRAVDSTRPDLIINQMTALGGDLDLRKFKRSFAQTTRLRTEGLDNLLAAADEFGVTRFISQSFAGMPLARVGGPVKTEDDPLDQNPPKQLREAAAAIVGLERKTLAAGGVALRYGGFYGPGTSMAPGGEQWQAVQERKMPIVGDGGGVWSFVHIEDAAAATVAAVENWKPGEIFNVADDDPATVSEWLPAAAEIIGAKPPRHLPRWVARLAVGEHAVVMMCEIRGATNEKAKRELGWTPAHPSWRQGFAELAAASPASATKVLRMDPTAEVRS